MKALRGLALISSNLHKKISFLINTYSFHSKNTSQTQAWTVKTNASYNEYLNLGETTYVNMRTLNAAYRITKKSNFVWKISFSL